MVDKEPVESSTEEGRPPLARRNAAANQLSKQARKRIGTHLRAMYETVTQQPVPSRFTDLIAQLDDASAEPTVDRC